MQSSDIANILDTWRIAMQTWLPAPLFGILLMLFAAFVALAFHRLIIRSVRRLLGSRYSFVSSLLGRTQKVSRLALVIFLLGAALPLAGFSDEATARVAQILLAAFIILIGWTTIIACELSADLYLRRFRLDEVDNLLARKHVTQTRILKRALETMIVLITAATALMTFESVRQFGVSLFASAGAAGLIVGLAARPLFANLIAGVQIAMTQPIRVDDALIVEGEWGRVEEITSTYVVIKIWDWRRLIVPLAYFLEHPFQNWTRHSASLIGVVYLHLDYTAPIERLREKLAEFAKASPLWDGDVVKLQISDTKERTIEVRALVSAASSGDAWDLRCEIREKLIDFLQREHPHALPVQRVELAKDTIPEMDRR
ncbi:MAG: mechanosensitive ion channel domain-containing protein [Parvibaculum sp.]|uniref:mechanosensitive ion channel family protein n=1 Tax=Parvibaculum sp. TaxID=2024848 RepID=UPI003C76DAE3